MIRYLPVGKINKTFFHVVSLLLLTTSPLANAMDNLPIVAPGINAKAYILMDYQSNKILAQFNADELLNPASLVKIMSSYVIGRAISEQKVALEDSVTIGKNAWATGNPVLRGSSLMFLQPGDKVNLLDLNRGMIVQSGNDASIALAEHIAGDQQTFVTQMNNYAKLLGMKNTHFLTVHGLDTEGQHSTARDMALLTQALIRDVPEEYALHQEKEFTFNKIRQINRNRLLWSHRLHVDGVKTGYTSGAGYNLVTSATEGQMRLIAVILGAPNADVRFSESEKLLSWGFRCYETVVPLNSDQPLVTPRIWFGGKKLVPLGAAKAWAITVPKGSGQEIKMQYTLTDTQLQAPLNKNQVVGSIDFYLNGKMIEQRPLVALEAVPAGSIFSRLWDFILLPFSQ